MFFVVAIAIICYFLYQMYERLFASSLLSPNNKYVLISGCDTGIGHLLARRLDQLGFNVFAGVLNEENVTLLKTKLSDRATVFRLDVTQQNDIDSVYNVVKGVTNNLHALVNNAGILTHGCIDWTSMHKMRQLMNVNFFGHVAMTKTFLPLLISKRDSRVVNVVSAAGFFTFPHTSAYSASKYALKSFSDCLRREMAPWSLRVSTIEPGALKTTMLDGYESNLRNTWSQLPNETKERWGIDYLNGMITKAVDSPFMTYADNPLRVVEAIQHAVTNCKPRIHYLPGWQSKVFFFVLYQIPAWLSDQLLAYFVDLHPNGSKHELLT